jgi:hypothetical protein
MKSDADAPAARRLARQPIKRKATYIAAMTKVAKGGSVTADGSKTGGGGPLGLSFNVLGSAIYLATGRFP